MESRSDGRKEKPPDGRAPRGRERRGGRGGADWSVERENGPPGWARRGKERAGEKVLGRGKEGKEGKREVGWAKNDREGERGFLLLLFLTKRFNQFNSNSREFKFKLDN